MREIVSREVHESKVWVGDVVLVFLLVLDRLVVGSSLPPFAAPLAARAPDAAARRATHPISTPLRPPQDAVAGAMVGVVTAVARRSGMLAHNWGVAGRPPVQ